MLLKPKKFKNYKIKKNRLHGLNYNSKNLTNGTFGLKALDYTRLTSKQIETTYMAINKMLQKQGKVYINKKKKKTITTKRIASRMGKGKGDIKYWVCLIKPGKILFEISDVDDIIAYKALKYGASKLPILTKIVKLQKIN